MLPDLESVLDVAHKDVEGRTLALELEEALLQALDQERVFLEYNRSIGGDGEVLLVDDVEEMRHYLAQKHRELSLERVDLVSNIRAGGWLDEARRTLRALEARAASPSASLAAGFVWHRSRRLAVCTWPRAAPDGCRVTTCLGTRARTT